MHGASRKDSAMVVIVGASRPSPVRRRNRNALAAGVWLVFLAYTVVSLQSSPLPPWRIALGWVGLAIFALFYLAL
ncbi:histidine kinase, partial [Cutibacterium acnes]